MEERTGMAESVVTGVEQELKGQEKASAMGVFSTRDVDNVTGQFGDVG